MRGCDLGQWNRQAALFSNALQNDSPSDANCSDDGSPTWPDDAVDCVCTALPLTLANKATAMREYFGRSMVGELGRGA